jgi:hypothetical protein
MIQLITFVFILSGSVFASSNIDLNGRVIDRNNAPVADAEVFLLQSALSTLTDTNGLFHFTGTIVSVNKEPAVHQSHFIGLRNGCIETGCHSESVITVFSLRGVLLHRVVVIERYRLPVDKVVPPAVKSQAVIISIHAGGRDYSLKAIKCGSQWLGNGTKLSGTTPLQSEKASVPAADTLVVLKKGKQPLSVPVPSLTASMNDIILLDLGDTMPDLIGDVTFSETSRTFTGQLSVSMDAAIPGAEIRYTIDGLPPATTSTLYNETPLTVAATTQLRAQLYVDGSPFGKPSTAIYILRTFDFTSDIPIVIMEGYGGGKPEDKENYIDLAFMTFEPVNGSASIAALPTVAARAGYHLRGQSSMRFEKAPYRVELWDNENNDADYPVLGMPPEADWAMIGPYMDKTLIRNVFVYSLGMNLGLSAMQYRFAEVYINQDSSALEPDDYQGVYTVVQTIKNQKTRLDLKQLRMDDTEPEKLSGGYIFKFDQGAVDSSETELECTGAEKMSGGFGRRDIDSSATCWDDLELVDPSPANPEQIAWITGYLQEFHDALHAEPVGNWVQYIDMPSFVDLFLIDEITRDVDAYIRSHYMYKERGEPVKAGPLWDYNFSLNSFPSDIAGWHWEENRRGSNDWHTIIWTQPEFIEAATNRWNELRTADFSDAAIDALVDEISAPLVNAAERDLEKWPIGEGMFGRMMGGDEDEEEDEEEQPQTWAGELESMKVWTKNRMAWLDSAFNAPQDTGSTVVESTLSE